MGAPGPSLLGTWIAHQPFDAKKTKASSFGWRPFLLPGLCPAAVWNTSQMKVLSLSLLVMLIAAPVSAQSPSNSTPRASMQQMLLPSHGSVLLGVFYLASGSGPHPTAILLHGFPGYEQNLDLAQALRSNGWNVLAVHYRGSWGVKGNFSFQHCIEDTDTEVQFILDPENIKKYRIDPQHVFLIGHSMGGYMAASAAAHNKRVAGVVLISAWNIGAGYDNRRHPGTESPDLEKEARSLGEEGNLAPLDGTSGMALAKEIHEHPTNLNFNSLAPAITPRPVLVITSDDGLAKADDQFAVALRKAGDQQVSELHFDTDHAYSDRRSDLIKAVSSWLQSSPIAH
jgi:uncharacterized protein